jgi:hypothetical protein
MLQASKGFRHKDFQSSGLVEPQAQIGREGLVG